MLIDITLKNFRSFKGEATLSLETGSRLSKYKDTNTFTWKNSKIPSLVKSAFIFGPNANGKTSVLRAFELISALLKNPTSDIEGELITDTFADNDEGSMFKVNFTKNEHLFTYFLYYDKSEIIEEYLDYDGKRVLHRQRQNFIITPDLLSPIIKTIRKNQLLLFVAQSYNYEVAQMAFTWFTKDVVFIRNNAMTINSDVLRQLRDSVNFKERLLNFMQAADFGINDFEIVERPGITSIIDEETHELRFVRSQEKKQLELSLRHQTENGGTFLLPLSAESEGTKIFVALALQLLVNSGQGKLLLIDEFERSLHFELAQALLQIFNHEKQANQFVLTTHNLELMDEKLRVDQIWFVEKNEYSESSLYSLFDFELSSVKRGDYSYKKRYIMGTFGAKQIVNQKRLIQNVFQDAPEII